MHPIPSRSSRIVALAAALLAACSMFPKLATLDQARAVLTGMTESQVTACLGTPGTQRTAGDGRAVWTYTQGLDAMSSPVPVSDPSQASFGYSPFAGAGRQPVHGRRGGAAAAGCLHAGTDLRQRAGVGRHIFGPRWRSAPAAGRVRGAGRAVPALKGAPGT